MGVTINQLVKQFGLSKPEVVRWGMSIPTQNGGIYIISLSDNPNLNNGILDNIPISRSIIEQWLKKVDGFELDNEKTYDADSVVNRLSQFWLPDENILYIGKSCGKKGIGNRVKEFYNTEYGEKGSHAGGHWLKSLSVLNNLFVYYIICENPNEIEFKMLDFFAKNISNSSKETLYDKALILPFANLKIEYVKKHGLGKMKIKKK